MDPLKNDRSSDLDTLDSPSTVVEPSGKNAAASNGEDKPSQNNTVVAPILGGNIIRRLMRYLNVYLLLFVLLLILSGIGTALFYLKAQHDNASSSNSPASQALSSSTLDSLANSDVTVGEPKHTLSVQSNAEFSGSVLMRGNLQVAGALQVGSNLAINGIRVTGNSTFDDVQITKSMAVTGNGSFQGQLNVQQNLNVNGGATFLGSVSAPSLIVGSMQLNGDLILTHHLSAGGSTPSRSSGSALGSSGTTSVSGSDSAGSVTINTGSNPVAGCFITINFNQHFNSTPHIVITPVGAAAAGLGYYINRSTSNFSICATNTPPGNTTFGFDYLTFD